MAGNATCICRSEAAPVLGCARGAEAEAVLCTLQGEGVVSCSLSTQETTHTWYLGSRDWSFAAPAVYSPAASRYFAALSRLAPADAGGSRHRLVSWAGDLVSRSLDSLEEVSTLEAMPLMLHVVNAAELRDEGPGQQPCGGVALIGGDGRVALCPGPAGQPASYGTAPPEGTRALASAACGSRLAVVATTPDRQHQIIIYCLEGGEIRRGASADISACGGTAPCAAALGPGHAAVLYPDASLRAWRLAADGAHLIPAACIDAADAPWGASVAESEAGAAAPAARGKRRGRPSNGIASPALAALGDSSFAVVMPAMDCGLTYAVVEGAFGCMLEAGTLPAMRGAGPAAPLVVPGDPRRLVVAAGGEAFTVDLQAAPATLAALIGIRAMRRAGPGAAATLPTQAPVPCVAPPLEGRDLEVAAATNPAADIMLPVDASQLAPATVEATVSLPSEGEAALGDADAAMHHVHSVLAVAAQLGPALPPAALPDLAQRLVERGHWGALEKLLTGTPPGALWLAGDLAPALAEAGQLGLLNSLLGQVRNMDAGDIARTLRALLGPASPRTVNNNASLATNSAAVAARAAWAEAVRGSAEAAVAAAEATPPGPARAAAVAAAAPLATAVDGFTPEHMALHALVAARHDSAVLLGALCTLDVHDALCLLRYLRDLLLHHNGLGDASVSDTAGPVVVPGLERVLAWAAAVLDAHFVTLRMNPGLPQPKAASWGPAQAAVALQHAVRAALEAARGVAALGGAVEHLRCGAPLPGPAAPRWLYAAELVDFRPH